MEDCKIKELAEKFGRASAIKFTDGDIDWKSTGGKPLAYLNWAVAWRTMKEVYPDANYRLIETPDGNLVWNVNGYGMLKCAVNACGVEYVENFPIMDNRNDAMKVETIDARDVNDSAQRGFTKCIARFGVGLYIYEGKLDGNPKAAAETRREPSHPAQRPAEAPRKPIGERPASPAQRKCIESMAQDKGYTVQEVSGLIKIDLGDALTMMNASKAIDALGKLSPKKKEEAVPVADDDLPF